MGKDKIVFEVPLLSGTISKAMAKCGNKRCRCYAKQNPALHGPYYRWTGIIEGKRTTITLTKTEAQQCERRIENYRRLQKKITLVLEVKKVLLKAQKKSSKEDTSVIEMAKEVFGMNAME